MSEYLDDTRRFVSVFRSVRREGMYLYVDRAEGLARVPDALRTLFGTPQLSLELVLTPSRKLAQADAKEVLTAIREQGFYLQMPPQIDDDMRAVVAANDKLQRR